MHHRLYVNTAGETKLDIPQLTPYPRPPAVCLFPTVVPPCVTAVSAFRRTLSTFWQTKQRIPSFFPQNKSPFKWLATRMVGFFDLCCWWVAIEEIISQAQNVCVMEWLSAINCSDSTHSVLCTCLESCSLHYPTTLRS